MGRYSGNFDFILKSQIFPDTSSYVCKSRGLRVVEVHLYLDRIYGRASDCLVPADPTNGSYYYTLTTYGAVATLTCDPGYITSHTSTTCNEAGQWSNMSSCERIGEGRTDTHTKREIT